MVITKSTISYKVILILLFLFITQLINSQDYYVQTQMGLMTTQELLKPF